MFEGLYQLASRRMTMEAGVFRPFGRAFQGADSHCSGKDVTGLTHSAMSAFQKGLKTI